MKTSVLTLGLALLCSAALPAATITSGTASFTIDDSGGFDGSPSANFVFGGDDNLFEFGWWVRSGSGTQESPLGTPTSVAVNGNQMTVTYGSLFGDLSDVNATILYTLNQSGNLATLTSQFSLTNNGATPVSLNLFNYIDVDLPPSVGNDSAFGGISGITITDPTGRQARFSGPGAGAFQVGAFSDLRNLLNDLAVTNLNNAGLPFASDDFTGAFQWLVNLGGYGGQGSVSSTLEISLVPFSSEIPEPSTYALMGLGLGLIYTRLRRR